jgi:transcription elongation factor SPT6
VRRGLKGLYGCYAVLTTTPTDKGKTEIDAYHVYRDIKRLVNKPITDVVPAQFVKILKAKKEGLLELTVNIPENYYEREFLKKLQDPFLSEGTSEVARKWNEERSLILGQALKDYLFPFLEKIIN